jgi:hypothetical protein
MPYYATGGSNSQTPNTVLPTVLQPGDEKYVFGTVGANPLPGISQNPNDSNVVAEAAVAGGASIAVQLGPRPGGGATPGLSVYVTSSTNPGSSEIDIQEADVDADGAYSLVTSTSKITTWTQVGALWVATIDISSVVGRFVRAYIKTLGTGGNWTVKFTYA